MSRVGSFSACTFARSDMFGISPLILDGISILMPSASITPFLIGVAGGPCSGKPNLNKEIHSMQRIFSQVNQRSVRRSSKHCSPPMKSTVSTVSRSSPWRISTNQKHPNSDSWRYTETTILIIRPPSTINFCCVL